MVTASPANLGSVQRTLLLPLWGRAVESKKPHPLLVDPAAVRIIESIDYDFSAISTNISFVTQLAWVARSLHIDRTIRQFVDKYPAATIVNVGCGLDTTFERVDNGTLKWYDLDLPDVIALRSQYIQQESRRKFIACSVFDNAWLDLLQNVGPVLFVAAGVLYYFEEEQAKALLCKLAVRFPGSEIAFDAASRRGVRMANQRVIQAGGKDKSVRLRWGLDRASVIEQWDRRIAVVAEYPLFRGLRKTLSMREKWGTFLSDALRIMSIVQLHFVDR